jgi:hypothetical protein
MEGGEMINVRMLDILYSVMILAIFIRIFWNAINRTHQLSHNFKKSVELEKELETRSLNQAELKELRKELQNLKRKK